MNLRDAHRTNVMMKAEKFNRIESISRLFHRRCLFTQILRSSSLSFVNFDTLHTAAVNIPFGSSFFLFFCSFFFSSLFKLTKEFQKRAKKENRKRRRRKKGKKIVVKEFLDAGAASSLFGLKLLIYFLHCSAKLRYIESR